MDGKLLSIDEVAAYLGVHRDTVYSLIRSGRLPALQLGGRKAGWRISEEDLDAFIRDGKAKAAAQTEADEDAVHDFDRRQREESASFQRLQQELREEFLARKGSLPRRIQDNRSA
jgi:excisionase family DNA binding protein